MSEVRLIDAIQLEKEIRRCARHVFHETQSTAESCADMVRDAPTIDPESLRPVWHPTSEIPPLIKRHYCDGGEPFVFYESAPLLLLMRDSDMKTGWFNRSGTGDCWMDEDGQTYNHRIAYWMELPEPPEGVPHD